MAMILMSGCTMPDQLSMRLGSLPFPGPLSLYAVADADDLGQHDYAPLISMLNDEQSRGILYTCRAGFLDLSHVRDAIDLTKYFYESLKESVRKGRRKVVVQGFSPCRFHVAFHFPDQWADARGAESLPEEIDEALIELGAQLSWIATTWYEILQWAGYSSLVVIPEDRSAFTYDDVIAHAVGADVGRLALREGRRSQAKFNDAATRWLDAQLAELQVVSPSETAEAVELVRGKWWEGLSAVRRQLDIGVDDGTVRPWLVEGLGSCDDVDPLNPEPYPVPPLQDSLRPDGKPLATIEIEMRTLEFHRIRAAIPDRPRRIMPHRDFPYIMEAIRRDLVQQYGENVDQPYPQWIVSPAGD